MTTLVDATTAQHAKGIGTVIDGVIGELSPEDDLIVAAGQDLAVPPEVAVRRVSLARTRVGRLAYQRLLLALDANRSTGSGHRIDRVLLLDAYAPLFRPGGVRYAALVHDVLPLTHPHYWPLSKRLVKRAAFAALKLSRARLFASTEHNAHAIRRLLGRDARVVRFGCGQLTDQEADRALAEPLSERKSCVTYVGAFEPRKNLLLLVEAFDRLAREAPELRLQLIGDGEASYVRALSDRIARSNARERIEIRSAAEKRDLVDLVARSAALAFPSVAEGFGLPILEALALGTPVVASELPEIKSWAGDAVRYASPDDWSSWTAPLLEAVASSVEWRRKGQRVAQQFRWYPCARGLLDF
jgi:glycosyltransferase involved in cell wall biosynthesis